MAGAGWDVVGVAKGAQKIGNCVFAGLPINAGCVIYKADPAGYIAIPLKRVNAGTALPLLADSEFQLVTHSVGFCAVNTSDRISDPALQWHG